MKSRSLAFRVRLRADSDTLKKFRYPETLVKEYKNWLLLCRVRHATLGSLVLLCKDEVEAFSKISEASAQELPVIIKEIESNLKGLFQYEKINYLMLMMYDPEVHFHIIPRYSTDKEFLGFTFKDAGWPEISNPGVPKLDVTNEISADILANLIAILRKSFN